jgi:hypothetical protein
VYQIFRGLVFGCVLCLGCGWGLFVVVVVAQRVFDVGCGGLWLVVVVHASFPC